MISMFMDPNQNPENFLNAHRNPDAPVDWDKVYEGYDAAIDWPTTAFWERLMKYYPDAKIILTVRDAEGWYKSAMNTIFNPDNFKQLGPDTPEQRRKVVEMAREVVVEGYFGGVEALKDKEAMCKKFNEHIEYVKSVVPADRLLVLGLGEGWEPLCKFLGKEIPNEPYPKTNSTEEFKNRDFNDPNFNFVVSDKQ